MDKDWIDTVGNKLEITNKNIIHARKMIRIRKILYFFYQNLVILLTFIWSWILSIEKGEVATYPFDSADNFIDSRVIAALPLILPLHIVNGLVSGLDIKYFKLRRKTKVIIFLMTTIISILAHVYTYVNIPSYFGSAVKYGVYDETNVSSKGK